MNECGRRAEEPAQNHSNEKNKERQSQSMNAKQRISKNVYAESVPTEEERKNLNMNSKCVLCVSSSFLQCVCKHLVHEY